MNIDRTPNIEALQVVRTRRPAAHTWAAWRPALLALLLGAVALAPRVAGLADFITTDEAYHWIARTERFAAAVAERRWAATAQTGHPGVTLMWLGTLGQALERALGPAWGSAPLPVAHLAWLRLPAALLQALLVPAGFLLLRRLLAPTTALLAGLLWATAPYLIAHARLLHLDALLTAFVTFSLLLLLIATNGGPGDKDTRTQGDKQQSRIPVSLSPGLRVSSLVGSGIFAGLALLTKGPALILLPFAGLLMIADCRLQIAGWRRPTSLIAKLRAVIVRYLLWLGVALLVVVLLWPALWVDPGRALREYVEEIASNGGRPNGDGQFFLGQAVGDPGPLFYPVADLFRMTPATTIGLLALLPGCLRFLAVDVRRRGGAALDGLLARQRTLLALAAFVLFWTLVMTLGPKKFDRYVLPTWPAIEILAAAGLAALPSKLRRTTNHGQPPGEHAARFVLCSLLCVLLAANLAWYHPYYLSYYNPLLGGGAGAQRALLIGWGEGMDQAGAWLRAQPDIGAGPVLSALGATLRPFVPAMVRDVADFSPGLANYAVVYIESVQRAADPPLYNTLQQTIPLHTVTIHGIDYARIYQLPRRFERAVEARWGAALRLRGVTIARQAGRLVVTPAWDVRAAPAADYQVFLHLIDAQGRRVAQIDVAPGGADFPPTSGWQPGRQVAVPLPLPLPARLPTGDYRLLMGLYDGAGGQRAPLTEGAAADPAIDGPAVVVLDTLSLP